MSKIICALLLLISMAGFGQMPISLFRYTPSVTPQKPNPSDTNAINEAEKSQIDPKLLDKYFQQDESQTDTGIKEQIIKNQIDKWKTGLSNVNKVDPALALYEANIISMLDERTRQLGGRIRTQATLNFKENESSAHAGDLGTINEIALSLDTLAKGYRAINRIAGNPKIRSRFVPVRNRFDAALLYQKYGTSFLQFGTNIALYGWNNTGTINPEVISFFAGPLRFAVNTLVSSTGSADSSLADDAKLRTLTGNGGNLVLSIYYPLFHTTSSMTQTLLQFSPKFVSEVPILGSPFKSDTLIGNINIGVDFNFSVGIPIFGKSSIYVYCRPAYLIGTLPYLNALGVQKSFFLMQETLGIDVPTIGRIGFALPPVTSISTLRTNTFLLSFQITPQTIGK